MSPIQEEGHSSDFCSERLRSFSIVQSSHLFANASLVSPLRRQPDVTRPSTFPSPLGFEWPFASLFELCRYVLAARLLARPVPASYPLLFDFASARTPASCLFSGANKPIAPYSDPFWQPLL